jgi:hypothetical protein
MPATPDKVFDGRDETIATVTLDLLSQRQPGASICPSEVARHLVNNEAAWRSLMPRVRIVAAQLVTQGKLLVTQQDHVVDAATARGAIRLCLPHKNGAA